MQRQNESGGNTHTGSFPPGDIPLYTGLELLQRYIDGIYPNAPMSERLDFWLAEVGEGRAVFRGMPGGEHLNPAGVVHGGWAAAILDSALGCAIQTTLGRGEIYTTIEVKVNFVRPITPQTGEVSCEGFVVHRGRTIAVAEAKLFDANGKLLALGTATCALMPYSR